MEQKILFSSKDNIELDIYFQESKIKTILLVCGKSIFSLRIHQYFKILEERLGIKVVYFMEFQPNPLYESVVKGVEIFHENHCDAIVAVGGGSAIDVAKCIKLYCNMNSKINYLEQSIIPNEIKLLAVPTTAGSGSEATKFAVIYYKGEKQSVSHASCIPETVLMDADTLKSLPKYQKKATMMDALCHGIESFWSVNSTEESKVYSKEAIRLIMENRNSYLKNEESGNLNMLQAANMAGKAINITQTTAGHAMCYKLTGLYGISHGHAAVLCVCKLWEYMYENVDKCIDPRGQKYLKSVFREIAETMGCETVEEAIRFLKGIVEELELKVPSLGSMNDLEILKTSVNPERLKNHPVRLDNDEIELLYREIFDLK